MKVSCYQIEVTLGYKSVDRSLALLIRASVRFLFALAVVLKGSSLLLHGVTTACSRCWISTKITICIQIFASIASNISISTQRWQSTRLSKLLLCRNFRSKLSVKAVIKPRLCFYSVFSFFNILIVICSIVGQYSRFFVSVTRWKSHWNSLKTSQFGIVVCLDSLQVGDCVFKGGSLPKMTEMVIDFWYVWLVAESDIWCGGNRGHTIVQIFYSNLWWKIILDGPCNGLIVLIDIGLSLSLGLLD